MEGASFKSPDDFPHTPVDLKFGEGDGTVNIRSAKACLKFSLDKERMKKFKLEEKEYFSEHVTMIYNPFILSKITKIVANAG